MSGTLFVVATPIGNLEDVTARALRVLGEVALIAAEDTRRTHHLLARYAITTPTTSLHEHNEGRKLTGLVDRLRRGEDVALVSDAGTPTISDPGQRLVRAAIDAGIRVEPIPGASAIISALAASGLIGQSFTFLGFPPVRSKDRKKWLVELSAAGRLVIFFEAPHRIRRTLGEIRTMIGDVQVAVGRELTKVHEEFLRGSVSQVLEKLEEPVGELTVVLDCGHTTEIDPRVAASPGEMAAELGRMTESSSVSKRAAIADLARKHGLSTNDVYNSLEAAKKLVE